MKKKNIVEVELQKDNWNGFFEIEEDEVKLLDLEEFPEKLTRKENIRLKNKAKRKKAAIAKRSEKNGLGLVKKGNHVASRKSKKAAKRIAHRKERRSDFNNGKSYRSVYDVSLPELMVKNRDRKNYKNGNEPLCRFVLQI